MVINKKNDVARLSGMSAGLRKHLAGQLLSLNNAPAKVDDLVAEFGAYTAQIAATAAARVAWKQQIQTERTMLTRIRAELVALENYLKATYGVSNEVLGDFGLTPRQPRKPTAPTRAAAVQKSLATREARHTMGKRQKAKIHGAPKETPTPATSNPASSGSSKAG